MASIRTTCPYCGSDKFHRTARGWAESSIKGVGALAVALGVGFFSEHHGHHLGIEMGKGNSSEYKCDKCGKTFRYSEKRGTYK